MNKKQIIKKIDNIANQFSDSPITKARLAQVAVACRIIITHKKISKKLLYNSYDYLASEFKTTNIKTIKRVASYGFNYLYPKNPDYWQLQDERYCKDIKKMNRIINL
jgi:hypothetical protein